MTLTTECNAYNHNVLRLNGCDKCKKCGAWLVK